METKNVIKAFPDLLSIMSSDDLCNFFEGFLDSISLNSLYNISNKIIRWKFKYWSLSVKQSLRYVNEEIFRNYVNLKMENKNKQLSLQFYFLDVGENVQFNFLFGINHLMLSKCDFVIDDDEKVIIYLQITCYQFHWSKWVIKMNWFWLEKCWNYEDSWFVLL